MVLLLWCSIVMVPLTCAWTVLCKLWDTNLGTGLLVVDLDVPMSDIAKLDTSKCKIGISPM